MKVVVTGSRHWKNIEQLEKRLDALLDDFPDMVLGHGDSRGGGVDAFADAWAKDRGVTVEPFPVDSDLDGHHRGAPMARNIRMLKTFEPDLVVGFRAPGKSNGTDHCIKNAEKLSIENEVNHEVA